MTTSEANRDPAFEEDDDAEAPEGEGEKPTWPSGDEDSAFELPEGFHSSETQGLVDRAQHGDVEALNDLFLRYYGQMVELARRRLGPRLRLKEDADDLAQTTFREATRDFRKYVYQGEGSLLRWLARILNNKIRDKAEFYSAHKRDISRERALEDGEDSSRVPAPRREPPSDDMSVTQRVALSEEVGILHEALKQLSPEHRQAITLVRFRGMPLREAGEHMGGRTEDAVRMLLRRAEARLYELTRRRLEE